MYNHVDDCKNRLNKHNQSDYNHRKKQMYIKLNHSNRVTINIEKILGSFNFDKSYDELGKATGLIHDIGRFGQMLKTGTYSDYTSFKNMININDHCDYGVKVLFDDKLIDKYDINPIYYSVLYNSIKYHGKINLPYYLRYQLNNDDKIFSKVRVEKFLSSLSDGSKDYLKLLSLYVQAVRDADKIDIYHQSITNEFPLVRSHFNFSPRGDKLYDVAKYWGLSEEEIISYNNIDSKDISKMNLIKIPMENIEPEKLAIPDDLINKFIKGETPSLNELVKERWYNCITSIIIRLNFLRDINFISTLKILQEQKTLEKIYNIYPDKYKPLVDEVISFSIEELINRPIEQMGNKTYVKKKIK